MEQQPQPLHRQRLLTIAVAAAGMLATFLPWASAPLLGSISGTAGDGWITLALFAAGIGLALRGDRATPIEPKMGVNIAVITGLAGVIGIYKVLRLAGVEGVSTGGGLYLLAAAGILAPQFATGKGVAKKFL